MRATWHHWWGTETVSILYHLKRMHTIRENAPFILFLTQQFLYFSPSSPHTVATVKLFHTQKQINLVCEDSHFLSFCAICSQTFFFFFFACPLLPLPGWQSWVVKHLESELSLLYSRPGQQAHSVQSSPSWQQPYCITMASASVISLCSVLPCFIWEKCG